VGVAPTTLEAAQRDSKHRLQVLDCIGVDLLEQGEAVTLVVAVMQQPILRLLLHGQHGI
jgi:hypothetical protein